MRLAKACRGKGGRKVDVAVDMTVTEEVVSQVSAMTNPETEAHGPLTWGWVETGVWTERMLAALGNGVKGGKCGPPAVAQCLLRKPWAFHPV